MLHDVKGGHQAYIHEKIDLWRIEFCSWLRPRAVRRLRARFAGDEIIKSLRSPNNYSPQVQFILLNKTALKIGVQSRLLGDQIRNEEVINSTRNRIYSLKVFYFLLYFIDGPVFQDYFLYRIRQNVLNRFSTRVTDDRHYVYGRRLYACIVTRKFTGPRFERNYIIPGD